MATTCSLARTAAAGACAAIAALTALGAQQNPTAASGSGAAVSAPREEGSVRFAVIGDTGTGDGPQYEVARQLTKAHETFPFEFVIMLGDNIYGSERPQDFVNKFEAPYKALLDSKIPFYAALGNHDDPAQRFYKPFNMDGHTYY